MDFHEGPRVKIKKHPSGCFFSKVNQYVNFAHENAEAFGRIARVFSPGIAHVPAQKFAHCDLDQ